MFYDLSNIIYRVQNDIKPKSRREIIFTRFIKLVEDHFRHERRVSWYAKELDITSKYLSESVKTVSHRTPNEWIDYYITLELRVQLKNSIKNIKEIAEELHFPNQSFLGKFFREHVGMSPSKYRKS
jgi:AraC-like DNA-binding protein